MSYNFTALKPGSRLTACGAPPLNARISCYVSAATPARNYYPGRLSYPSALRVLANTVGDQFHPGNPHRARKKLGISGQPILLTVGRLHGGERYKGHDRILRALPDLTAEFSEIIYVVAGDGDDRARLERLACRVGVHRHVRFLGRVEDDDLADLYRAADLFVLPSTGEGFGIVFLEAMASGTRALGLASHGAMDPLGDGRLGVACEKAALTDRLTQILGEQTLDRIDLANRVRVRFGSDVFASRANALIGELAA